jgi:ABC-type polar amino acid transport system ATPase subunit
MIEFAEEFADRIAFMDNGVILEHGAARSFRTDAAQGVTQQFLRRTLRK